MGPDAHCVSVSSCMAALHLAYLHLGFGPGDEVIVPAQTHSATAHAVEWVGATPVFVDCDLITRNIDLDAVERRIGPRTRAILPTHWPGSLIDLDALYALAKDKSLRVIEDAALVMGSTYRGHPVGAIGDLVAFSFHPNKNMTSIEGGALVVNDAIEARDVEALRFHGIRKLADGTRDAVVPGRKFNLPDVNACVGVAQLARLPAFLARRRVLAERYFARWHAEPACELPPRPAAGDGQSWNMFCIVLPLDALAWTRAQVRDALAARGIATGISYEAVHLSTVGRRYGYQRGDLPHAERIAAGTLTLPLHAGLDEADVDRVCAACASVLREAAR